MIFAAVNTVELTVFIALFGLVTVLGFVAVALAPGEVARQPRRVGPRRAQLRLLDHVVPRRRRPLHRVHVRRRPGAAVRRRRARVLRRALHDRRLPDGVPGRPAAVVGVAPQRLRHARRLHPRPLRLRLAGADDRDHRHRRDDALHRAAADRHRGRAEDDGHPRPLADHHRLRRPRRVHVLVGPARAGADRVRQGLADLPRRDRRGDLHPDAARRLRRHLRGGRQEVLRHRAADRRRAARRRRGARLLDARVRLRARAVPLSALGDGRARRAQPRHDQAQHGRAAGLQHRARAARPARLHGDRGRDRADRHGRQAGSEHDRPAAVRRHVPVLVRGGRVRRDRDRRAGARGDHVDRGGEPVDAQHLQGVPQPRRHAGAGGALEQARLARGQGRRGGRDPAARPAVLDRPAADRRRDHPADAAGDRARPVHALLPRVGPARGLGHRPGGGHVDALRHAERGDGQGALRRPAVRAVALRLRHACRPSTRA